MADVLEALLGEHHRGEALVGRAGLLWAVAEEPRTGRRRRSSQLPFEKLLEDRIVPVALVHLEQHPAEDSLYREDEDRQIGAQRGKGQVVSGGRGTVAKDTFRPLREAEIDEDGVGAVRRDVTSVFQPHLGALNEVLAVSAALQSLVHLEASAQLPPPTPLHRLAGAWLSQRLDRDQDLAQSLGQLKAASAGRLEERKRGTEEGLGAAVLADDDQRPERKAEPLVVRNLKR